MADKRINVSVQLRNDTEANWLLVADTYKPLAGEACVTIDGEHKGQVKFGDGESTWGELEYAGAPDVVSAQHFTGEATGEQTDDDVLAEITEGAVLAVGDTAVITRAFAGGKTSYTAYVYNGSAWAAMDGNYSATNVFLNSDITLAGDFSTVGNYSKGDVINAGTSLESILSGMLQQELYPTTTDYPSAAITASGGSGEVGSSYTLPTATLTINDVGSYTYGPATGITIAIDDASLTQGSNTVKNTSVMAKGSTIKLQATDTTTLYTDASKSYTFSATAKYSDGAVPVTNLGNAYPSQQITSGNITIDNKTVSFTGYRYAFAGGTTAAAIDSAVARSMSAKKSSKASMDTQGEALEFTAAKGATKVFFTYPATWTGTPYFEMFGLAWAENTDIVAKSNIQVADYRGTNEDGTLNGAVAYKLYCWELDTPLQAESTKFRVWFK